MATSAPELIGASGMVAVPTSPQRGISTREWMIFGGFAIASVVLVLVMTGNMAIAIGVAAGSMMVGGALWVMRSMFVAPQSDAQFIPDWLLTRSAIDQLGIAMAITDRSGKLVCANDLFASWFGGYVTPPDLPLNDNGAERLSDAGRSAWRDGFGALDHISVGTLRLSGDVRRAGRADDYLLWRFRVVEERNPIQEAVRLITGTPGRMLSASGVMLVLVGPEGQIKAASPAFLARAAGSIDANVLGTEFAGFLRVDDHGSLFFEREKEHATPLRLIQAPFIRDDSESPILLLLFDEDGTTADRGFALNYIETLLSLLPFGLAMVDRDGRFLFMNQAFQRGVGMISGLPPRYPGDLVVAEDKAALGDMVRRYASGQQLGGDIAVRLKAQPDEPIAIGIAGVRGLGEAAVLLSLKDSQEESKLKRQVAQASKMQAVGQLAGGIAHDFNNILTAILGTCDLMLLRHTPGDSDYDGIQQVRSNANRAANLTRQLLAFSRQQTLRPQVLNLSDIVADVTHLLNRLLGDHVHLKVQHGRGIGLVRADPGQMEQVIMNLVVNGRDAMPNGGELMVETFAIAADDVRKMRSDVLPVADYSVLRVTDQGTGIPPDVLPKIFEPFFTTKEVGKGTGLGLSTVYGIVKQTGGFIFADSPPGQGACFTIYLPVHEGPAPTPQRNSTASSEAAADGWGTGTILLVEDEDVVRTVAERALSRAGYTVLAAANGEEGVALFKEAATIDLVLSDVVMPQMDGPAMAAIIRDLRVDVPVVFMSGYAEEQLRQSIDLDNVDFLPKPFSVAQLTDRVTRTLDAHRAGEVS